MQKQKKILSFLMAVIMALININISFATETILNDNYEDCEEIGIWEYDYSDDIEIDTGDNEYIDIETYNDSMAVFSSGGFPYTPTAHAEGYGSVSLDWSTYDYADKNFRVFKSETGENGEYESVGIDYTMVTQVKCLQISPKADTKTMTRLKRWVQDTTYGKGIISVDSVSLADFKADPNSYLKDSNGRYKYDVLFFGTADWNGSGDANGDLNYTSRVAVEQFIKTGRGCIGGHDTIEMYNNNQHPHDYFNQLKDYFNIELHHDYNAYKNGSTKVKIVRTGLFTNYPNKIGELGQVLTIPSCHNMGQIANGKIWLKFDTDTINSNRNFYLTTYNNCAMIQTGHSNDGTTEQEKMILANLIFYCNQLMFNSHLFKDASAQDFASPNIPTVEVSENNCTFSADDNGSIYWYYVKSYDKEDTTDSGLIDTSDKKSIEVKTGVRTYRYIMDDSLNTSIVMSDDGTVNGTVTTSNTIPRNSSYTYIHVAAVDGAGNVGPTATARIDKYTKLHFDANGGSGNVPADTEIKASVGQNIGSATPARTGYDFRGWGVDTSWCLKRISYLGTGIPRNRGIGGAESKITAGSWKQADYATHLGVDELGEEQPPQQIGIKNINQYTIST